MTLYLNEMLKLRTVRSTYYLLLIAQAITENMPILTVDPQFQKYEIQLIA